MFKKDVNVNVDANGTDSPGWSSTASLDTNIEAHGIKTGTVEEKLDRRLQSRHLQMIAIGMRYCTT